MSSLPHAAGLCGSKITGLLPCVRDVDGGPSEIATPRLVSDLSMERDRIGRKIEEPRRSREVLDDVIATARRTGSGPGADPTGR